MNTIASLCAVGAVGLALFSVVTQEVGGIGDEPGKLIRARIEIRELQTLVGMYEQDHGEWPSGESGASWHGALASRGYLPEAVLSDGVWLDPWGRAYAYLDDLAPERAWSPVTQSPAVYSFGPDGIDDRGERDDVLLGASSQYALAR